MAHFKKDRCPGCLPDAKAAYFDADTVYDTDDETGRMVWTCRNCGEQIPRYVYKRRVSHRDGLTRSQEHELERLKHVFRRQGDEIKKFTWETTYDAHIWLVAETGMARDEGTMLGIVGRDRWYLMVGPRGGTVAYGHPKWWSGKTMGITKNKRSHAT